MHVMDNVTPSYLEELISQIPALQLLMNMGYRYLTPDEAFISRLAKQRNVLLEGILEPWLRQHNRIQLRGQTHDFSDANIALALRALKAESNEGLVRTNEKLYELLTLGTSLEQTIDGDRKSFTLHYIDWKNPANNVYHVTDEFSVERAASYDTRRPDIVVFVNGIPLVVIECKRPDLDKGGEKAVAEAVSQMLRNQRGDEIPHLFTYAQLLLAVSKNDALYATVGTHGKFWAVWREETDVEPDVHALVNRPLNTAQKDRLYAHRDQANAVRAYFDGLETSGERLPTEQDRTLYGLLRPERLLELIYQFIVFDGGEKKIARYQQYFAVKATIERVAHLGPQGTRAGGVIWHTTGSGKSLTMVMLAKAITLHPNIANPRVVLVTDRIDLDDQIWKTFRACGKKAEKATSGKNLIELVRSDKVDIITTVIDKFETAAKEGIKDHNPDIFVLVDESHRGQYGNIHSRMKQVFERACYIGFTGTPLLKKDKQTAQRFGGFIHKYTMRQAVADNAVVPLLYEGRLVELDVNQQALDEWFEKRTRKLTEDQKIDLKRKMSSRGEVSRAEQRIAAIALDVAMHYEDNFRGTGFKAQLATSSKDEAIKYLRYLEDEDISAAVIISAPDTREGSETIDDDNLPVVEAFWRRMMTQYGGEENYLREILASFKREDGIEILIVVDKLLVGFDEPRNTVLYIDKPLREHGLLQAIARVNRLFEGKDFGYIIDYRGVLGKLNEAMQVYNALEEYDAEDVQGAVTDAREVIRQLPQLHERLWDIFKTVENRQDTEALERFLEPEDRRETFYEALTDFARALKVAFATLEFYNETPRERIDTYKRDLVFFHNLRASVKQRYAETIDYRDYEDKIRKLMDSHIQATGVSPLTELVNIFDREQFDKEVERIEGTAAKADTIAYRLRRTITENMDKDPAFYRKFSHLIEETIRTYREERMNELEYFAAMNDILQLVRTGAGRDLPVALNGHFHASAYYGILSDQLTRFQGDEDKAAFADFVAEIAVQVEALIAARQVRDWVSNKDIHNEIRNDIEDLLYTVKDEQDIPLTTSDMDVMIEALLEVARKRDSLA